MTSPASLTVLPLEIFNHVTSLLPQSSLPSLCRVRKRFEVVISPQLYSHISLHWQHLCRKCPTLDILLHTLVRRPALASRVQTLQLSGWLPCTFDHDIVIKVAGNDRKDVLRCLTLNLSFPDNSAFTLGFAADNVLDVGSALEHVTFHDFPLHVLQGAPSLEDFLTFDALPSMRFLSMKVIERPRSLLLPSLLSLPPSQSLTSLVLLQSHLSHEALSQLLARTPRLTKFEYRFACRVNSLAPLPRYFDSPRVTRALRQIRTTLRSLTLSVSFFPMLAIDVTTLDPDQHTVINRLGSLAGFIHLEQLHVPLIVLFGWDPEGIVPEDVFNCLPPRLRSLGLRDDMAGWDAYQWTSRMTGSTIRAMLAGWDRTRGPLEVKLITSTPEAYRTHEHWTAESLRDLRNLDDRSEISYVLHRKGTDGITGLKWTD
ncbi:MAG: hypothetical protein M1817_000464 [Caeruleum heppii]|nr:MAG: hypothetical protein M1817_000464 [Caeruleum heppii]